ncbi:arginine biosynthesis bifunctional protein [Candidatus Methylomirabilis lanthanidiphila]|uniref:Arginine biosynthesis bifunctional protein ArgJ n=1 Tax=Candidatus Methylomirabilis lanthanidiphila TaxID=2211376 RepID=A0A564ZK70_9BACT|nr:bifunctional glutamate N-acetyltransferase/amino-acid acetyltransferase ArgJ [Candidatus Methylomirabilis lanthanidiphila]VUZ85257.1 arginine biosynthesis bifunctional protein [Candidatus Methylomirabilis lanthanidiphila]
MKQPTIRDIPGGITAAKGIRAAGVHSGIKKTALDLALIVSDRPATVAGVTTSNRSKAAPVLLCEQQLKGGRLSAIVANSGNANACTGFQGERDAVQMRDRLAGLLDRPAGEVFVASTGVIGQRLPIAKVLSGIPDGVGRLSVGGGEAAARAIMTTDTCPKEAAVGFELDGKPVVIGGIAKGSGMIAPHLATMLCFVGTDAKISAPLLRRILRRTVEESFNAITVDGCMSTNDTVLVFANGMSETPPLKAGTPRLDVFEKALLQVLSRLARMIVMDGEGATKLIRIEVMGAPTARDAKVAAKAIANSPLVKTAFFGEDCNWGRIVSAIGASGIRFDPDCVEISVGRIPVVRKGLGLGAAAERRAAMRMRRPEFEVTVNLHGGTGGAAILTTDLSEAYVRINAGYRS